MESGGKSGSTVRTASTDPLPGAKTDIAAFSQGLTEALWLSGDARVLEAAYAPYAGLHRSPLEIVSGRPAIIDHFGGLRRAFTCDGASVDHVATQPAGNNVLSVATRWAVCGTHTGQFLGAEASGKPVYIMGVTHRRIVDGRIAVEWTVFDSLSVMSQLL